MCLLYDGFFSFAVVRQNIFIFFFPFPLSPFLSIITNVFLSINSGKGAKPKIQGTTQSAYEVRIYNHIIPDIGHISLNKLTQNDLQQYYTRLKHTGRLIRTELYGEGLSDRMIRGIHASCRAGLQKAVEDGLIRVNPAIGCKLPPKKAREMQVLTREEMQRFLIQAKAEGYYELFLLELSTGLRRGELMALQWDDLNFDTGELRINKQIGRIKGKLTVTTPKTKTSIRTIILPPPLLKVLKECKETVNSRWLFPSPVKEDIPMDPANVRGRLHLILEHAGCKQVRFHDLRHPYVKHTTKNIILKSRKPKLSDNRPDNLGFLLL